MPTASTKPAPARPYRSPPPDPDPPAPSSTASTIGTSSWRSAPSTWKTTSAGCRRRPSELIGHPGQGRDAVADAAGVALGQGGDRRRAGGGVHPHGGQAEQLRD